MLYIFLCFIILKRSIIIILKITTSYLQSSEVLLSLLHEKIEGKRIVSVYYQEQCVAEGYIISSVSIILNFTRGRAIL